MCASNVTRHIYHLTYLKDSTIFCWNITSTAPNALTETWQVWLTCQVFLAPRSAR